MRLLFKILIIVAIILVSLFFLGLFYVIAILSSVGDTPQEVPKWIIDISEQCEENYLGKGYSNYRSCQLQEPQKIADWCKNNYLNADYQTVTDCLYEKPLNEIEK